MGASNLNNKESESRTRKFIALGVIGLIVLIGFSIIIPFITTTVFSGVHSQFVYFPFHFGFIGVVLLIFVIFLISRWIFWSNRFGDSSRYYPQYSGNDSAQNILKERYAKGEITKEQFEQIKKDLEHDS